MGGPVKDDPHWIRRWWERVDKQPDGCWYWTGRFDQNGYGTCNIPLGGGKFTMPAAHRFGYELLVGPIPAGLVIDHLCRVPKCVNPAHLEPVTQAENVRRGNLAQSVRAKWLAETHCQRGHELSGDNRSRLAFCRQCNREGKRLAQRRRRVVTEICGFIAPRGTAGCQRQQGHTGRHHSQKIVFMETPTR